MRVGSGVASYAASRAGRREAETVLAREGQLTGRMVTAVRRVRWKSKPSVGLASVRANRRCDRASLKAERRDARCSNAHVYPHVKREDCGENLLQ